MEDFIKKNNIKKPNFFIIGAPKCGTTSMARYLGEHPDIFFSDPKEPKYFNTDFSKKVRGLLTEKGYLKIFKGSNNYEAVGEGSTSYLRSRKAIFNILEFNPEAKFIVMVRDEVEMFRSLHWQALKSFTENVSDPEKAWRLQEERSNGENIPITCLEPKSLNYKETCNLGKQVKRALEIIKDKNKIKIVRLEDFKNTPRNIYKEVLGFLEVKDDGRKNFPVYNKASIRKSKVVKIIRILANIEFINNISRFLKRIIRFYYWPFLKKLNKKTKREFPKPPISKKFRQELEEYFKEDQKLLDKLIEEIRSK